MYTLASLSVTSDDTKNGLEDVHYVDECGVESELLKHRQNLIHTLCERSDRVELQ